jgi:hypothetical protein
MSNLLDSLPLKTPSIAKGGTNREGLTWAEWEAAARFGGGKPANMFEASLWSRAWACGFDPTEMGQ